MESQLGYKEGCSYIIVLDTLGDGLRSFDSYGIDIYHSEEELKFGIVESYYKATDILGLDSEDSPKKNKLAIESMVVCEVSNMEGYVIQTVKQHLRKEKDEEYQTYLRLKEKFEGSNL